MALLSTKTGLPSFSAVDASIVNYFTDPGFERGTDGTLPSGWLQYNDGAVAVPVNGTGGSANASVTLLTTTAGAIRGTKSALLTKGPGNQQGTGYSYDFTISNVDKGVTAGVDFELLTSANYVSGDMVFYIYDVTNSILITPRAVALPKLDNFGRFFTDYGLQTGTSYRFILHIATTNANAWTITLDTMINSTTRTAVPGATVYIHESVSTYTIGATTTPPTPGAGATFFRETVNNGDGTATIRFEYRQANAGAAGSGDYLLPLPTGLNINYARAAATLTTSNWSGTVGYGTLLVNGAPWEAVFQVLNSGLYANRVIVSLFNETTSGSGWGGATASLANANVQISGYARIPITEWAGSGTNFITDNLIESNARARYYRNAAYSYTSGNQFDWDAQDTTTFRTNGSWTNSLGAIGVPATGIYQINVSIQSSVLLASDPQLEIQVNRQGAGNVQERVIDREGGVSYKASGTAFVYLLRGDTFRIILGSNATVVTGTVFTFLEVIRISDVSSRGPIGFGSATSSEKGLVFKGRYQTKILASNVTTTGAVASLTFNNLTIGKTYRVCGTASWAQLASNLQVQLDFFDGTTAGTKISGGIQTNGIWTSGLTSLEGQSSFCFIYTATTTLMTPRWNTGSVNGILGGNGTRGSTFIQMEEIDIEQTTAWT